jgi:hypothetical protein
VFPVGESVPRAYRKAQSAAHVQYLYLHRQLLALFYGLHRPHLHNVTWAASITCQVFRPKCKCTLLFARQPCITQVREPFQNAGSRSHV